MIHKTKGNKTIVVTKRKRNNIMNNFSLFVSEMFLDSSYNNRHTKRAT